MERLNRYRQLIGYSALLFVIWIVVKVLTLLRLPRPRKKSVGKTRVLFLECMGPPSAGYRHRSQGWVTVLNENDFEAECWYVMPYAEQVQLQKTPKSMLRLHAAYLRKRFVQCWRSADFDTVVVRRELLLYNDYGNLFFEKWMHRIHPHLILDIDDDIAAAKHEPRRISVVGKLLGEHPQKFTRSLAYYDSAIAASSYLRDKLISSQPNLQIKVIPTCVDYYKRKRKDYADRLASNRKLVIGWVGSSYNFHDLAVASEVLQTLVSRDAVEVLIVSNAKPDFKFPFTFAAWNEERELDNLLRVDIGIMPVEQSAEGRGKGGFKLIQYMGCGIVSIATALTVNEEIIEHNLNGFLVRDEDNWLDTLDYVIQQRNDFARIGNNAVSTVKEKFSYEANLHKYAALLSNTDEATNKRDLTNKQRQTKHG